MIKNLLVTGGCGFIGSNFIRYLFQQPDFHGRIINVDKLTYAGNIFNLTDVASHYRDRYVFVHGDICDFEQMKEVIEREDIDCICHFAAESHVDRSIKGPAAFIQTNIIGTFNLLELVREKRDFSLFHHVSTDEVYGSLGSDGLFREESPYRPSSPYAASKAASDHLVRAYYKTYGLPITISNCSNNYGPYQFPEKLIPLMIWHGWQGKPLPVYGDGKNVRDWLYVEDHCAAIWTIMKQGRRGETYNVGGCQEMENIAVVRMICDLLDELLPPLKTGKRRNLITFVPDRPGHDRRYAIDATKLMEELGWRPKENFVSGLRKTVQWYVQNEKWIQSVTSGAYRNWVSTHYGMI